MDVLWYRSVNQGYTIHCRVLLELPQAFTYLGNILVGKRQFPQTGIKPGSPAAQAAVWPSDKFCLLQCNGFRGWQVPLEEKKKNHKKLPRAIVGPVSSAAVWLTEQRTPSDIGQQRYIRAPVPLVCLIMADRRKKSEPRSPASEGTAQHREPVLPATKSEEQKYTNISP